MVKISKQAIEPKEMGWYINNLWSVFTLIDSKDQIRALFKDLFTHTEYKMLAKRLEIARMLQDGETYEAIMQKLKVTERTIANISNILERDGTGLRIAYEKLKDLERLFKSKREARQDYLEHRNLPKLPEQKLVKNLLKAGLNAVNKSTRNKTREFTSTKYLSV